MEVYESYGLDPSQGALSLALSVFQNIDLDLPELEEQIQPLAQLLSICSIKTKECLENPMLREEASSWSSLGLSIQMKLNKICLDFPS